MYKTLAPLISVSSNSFRVESQGMSHEAIERYQAHLKRKETKTTVISLQNY
jgi:hypothetical protein